MATHFNHVFLYKKGSWLHRKWIPFAGIRESSMSTLTYSVTEYQNWRPHHPSNRIIRFPSFTAWKEDGLENVMFTAGVGVLYINVVRLFFTPAEWPVSSSAPMDLCNRLPTRLTKCPTVITAHVRCWGGVRDRATYRACMAILLVAASHERSIKTCRPPAVLYVNQGCTVSQKCSS